MNQDNETKLYEDYKKTFKEDNKTFAERINEYPPEILILVWVILCGIFYVLYFKYTGGYTLATNQTLINNTLITQTIPIPIDTTLIWALFIGGIVVIILYRGMPETTKNKIIDEDMAKAILLKTIGNKQAQSRGEVPRGNVYPNIQSKLVWADSRDEKGRYTKTPVYWRLGFTLKDYHNLTKRYKADIALSGDWAGKITKIQEDVSGTPLEGAEDIKIPKKDPFEDVYARARRRMATKQERQVESSLMEDLDES